MYNNEFNFKGKRAPAAVLALLLALLLLEELVAASLARRLTFRVRVGLALRRRLAAHVTVVCRASLHNFRCNDQRTATMSHPVLSKILIPGAASSPSTALVVTSPATVTGVAAAGLVLCSSPSESVAQPSPLLFRLRSVSRLRSTILRATRWGDGVEETVLMTRLCRPLRGLGVV